jgi:hypothetical protein
MPRGFRFALVLGLLHGSIARASENENWERLRAMPLEQRRILAGKLTDFNGLSRDERAAVRAIDAKVEALSSADRATYRSVLRRYHAWLRSLPPEKQKAIEAAPADQKITLIAKFRSEETVPTAETPSSAALKVTDLSGPSVYSAARLLKTWLELSDAERKDVEKKDFADRNGRLNELARKKNVKLQPFDLSENEISEIMKKIDTNTPFRMLIGNSAKGKGKSEEKSTKARRRIAENYHAITTTPKAVKPEALFRFESAMPSWVRAQFDVLPPADAKRRLTILYRLIYPHPEEMPQSSPKPAPKAASIPADGRAAPAPRASPAL